MNFGENDYWKKAEDALYENAVTDLKIKQEQEKRKDKKDNRRYWLNFSIGFLALLVASISLRIQCMQYKPEQLPNQSKGILQKPLLSDSTKRNIPKTPHKNQSDTVRKN